MSMDTEYCNNCGLLHDPNDGDCLGCGLIKEKKTLEAKLVKAVEYNKTFLGYALADRYQWDNDFLVEVGKHIKNLEEIEKGD